MDGKLGTYSNNTNLFKALTWTLVFSYTSLVFGAVLRTNCSIIRTYKKQVIGILMCIIGNALSKKYIVRIILLLSAFWSIQLTSRWFICDIGDIFYLSITFIITDISISFYCFYKLEWHNKKKHNLQCISRIVFIVLFLIYVLLSVADLINRKQNSLYEEIIDICSMFIWFCVMLATLTSSTLLLKVARMNFTEEIVGKIKKNVIFLVGFFLVSNGLFYVIEFAFLYVKGEKER